MNDAERKQLHEDLAKTVPLRAFTDDERRYTLDHLLAVLPVPEAPRWLCAIMHVLYQELSD